VLAAVTRGNSQLTPTAWQIPSRDEHQESGRRVDGCELGMHLRDVRSRDGKHLRRQRTIVDLENQLRPPRIASRAGEHPARDTQQTLDLLARQGSSREPSIPSDSVSVDVSPAPLG
jgi:hypothetical protein